MNASNDRASVISSSPLALAASRYSERSEAFDWYRRWREQQGRALRVLHLGNIANNAFNNARIQRQYGIESFVIAYENYHIMACPEWEEATFEGDLGDPFFPDWTKVDLGGYRRPNWFASGPLELCCSMIAAEVSGQVESADRLRRSLEWARQTACSTALLSRTVRVAEKVKRRILRAVATFDPDFERLVEIWKQGADLRFPPKAGDFANYRSRVAPLAALFNHFDIIQAYSTDGAWPLLANRPYISYEHGTLRVIPFHDDMTGRLAATTFLGANHVFVTNIDCLEAAKRLGIPQHRTTPLPHAFDDTKLIDFKNGACEIKPPGDGVVFFHPTRQDWQDSNLSLIKGNDRLIKAFAAVSREHPESRLVMIAWGRDLYASRELVRSLSLEDKVQWIAPMRKSALWKMYLSSHAVIDQFDVPSFGGITFEALALGKRVITNIEFATAEEFFSVPPPILSASTETEIAVALRKVIADRNDDRGVGESGSLWIHRYHSAERIVELQLQAYKSLI